MVDIINTLIVANSALTPLAVLVALVYIGLQVKRVATYVDHEMKRKDDITLRELAQRLNQR